MDRTTATVSLQLGCVPATVIASNGIARPRARASLARVAERAEPTVRRLLS